MAAHTMFDGRLQIYRRKDSGSWHAAARVGKRRFRQSLKEERLEQAKDIAEEWYLGLRGKLRAGEITPSEHTFKDAFEDYLRDVRVLAATERSPSYVTNLELRVRRHVLPYFEDKPLSTINKSMVQKYRVKRAEDTIARTTVKDGDGNVTKAGKPPARNTMMNEIVHIRQILKHAEGLNWISFVPSLETPYMTQTKRGHRAWFSPEEYKQLREATRRRITEGKRPGWEGQYEDMHDFVVMMANTGLRPDEFMRLEIRDVKIEEDYSTKKTILVIAVRGKVGVGICKSMPDAVFPFTNLRNRREAELKEAGKSDQQIKALLPKTRLLPRFYRAMFNEILKEEDLKFDREGQRRTAYSLRHTYISMRLSEGADIYALAINCRTSVEMIQEFYARHIKEQISTAAVNVMRPRREREFEKKKRRQSPVETTDSE